MAVRAIKERHVLHHAKDINANSFEHVNALDRVFRCQSVWCSDDYRP